MRRVSLLWNINYQIRTQVISLWELQQTIGKKKQKTKKQVPGLCTITRQRFRVLWILDRVKTMRAKSNMESHILTRKIAAALDRNGRCSGQRLFPLKILHWTSSATPSINIPLSACFLIIGSDNGAGTGSASLNTKFCKVSKILLQSSQQNHLSLGSSCSKMKENIITLATKKIQTNTWFKTHF